MIGLLEGELRGMKNGTALVMCGGVGYKVSVSAYTLGKIAGSDRSGSSAPWRWSVRGYPLERLAQILQRGGTA